MNMYVWFRKFVKGAAVEGFAKRAGYKLIAEFSDDAVKGSDPVDARPGFAAMLARIASNGVRTLIVEAASRFAHDLIVQETGYRFLRDAGITLIAADRRSARPGSAGDARATPSALQTRSHWRRNSGAIRSMVTSDP